MHRKNYFAKFMKNNGNQEKPSKSGKLRDEDYRGYTKGTKE